MQVGWVLFHRTVSALQVQSLGIRARHLKFQRLERTDFGHKAKERSEDPGARARLLIRLSPLTLEISAFQVVKKLLLCKCWVFFDQFVFLEQKRDPRHLGNHAADGVPKTTDR